MSEPQFQLERYFYPRQEVRANPLHDKSQETKTASEIVFEIGKDPGIPRALNVTCRLTIDLASSVNPPYDFALEVFGIFIGDRDIQDSDKIKLAHFEVPALVGAIRERLAEMTSRAPWGPLTLDITNGQQLDLNFRVDR